MPVVIEPAAGHVSAADLRTALPSATVREPDREAVAEVLATIEEPAVLLCSNTAWRERYLGALSAGDWVLTTTAGYDGYPVEALRERGVLLTNSPGISPGTVAEHAVGMAVAANRRFDVYRRRQREREWGRRREDLTDLAGEAACVVGLGRVGGAVARRLRAFEATVRGVKRDVEGYDGDVEEYDGDVEVHPPGDLLGALEGAGLAVLAVPLTDETRGLVGRPELAAMAADGVVVNVARGPVLDTDALLAALDAGELRAAALDVFDEEPLPEDSPLWDREDVFLTPHCAGTTDKYGERALEVVVEQYRRWEAGEDLRYRVV